MDHLPKQFCCDKVSKEYSHMLKSSVLFFIIPNCFKGRENKNLRMDNKKKKTKTKKISKFLKCCSYNNLTLQHYLVPEKLSVIETVD